MPSWQHLPLQSDQEEPAHQAKKRRRNYRARLACTECRHRRTRCDEGIPECGNCKLNDLKCFYETGAESKQRSHSHACPDVIEILDKVDEKITYLQRYLRDTSMRKPSFVSTNDCSSFSDGNGTAITQMVLSQPSSGVCDAPPSHESDSAFQDGVQSQHGILRQSFSVPWEGSRPQQCTHGSHASETPEDYLGHYESNHHIEIATSKSQASARPIGRGSKSSSTSMPLQSVGLDTTYESTGKLTSIAHIRSLTQTFLNHVHTAIPFLDAQVFLQRLDDFCDFIDPQRSSNVGHGANKQSKNGSETKVARETSVHLEDQALILLALALGASCEYESRPNPSAAGMDQGYAFQRSSSFGQENTVPFRAPIPAMSGAGSRGNKTDNGGDECSKVADLPGIRHYTRAVTILGQIHGLSTENYVAACLLATIYLNKHLLVRDSARWLSTASVSWLMYFQDIGRNVSKLTDTAIRLYWACYILETDALAISQAIPSGIQQIERQIPLPAADVAEDQYASREVYLATISLYRITNSVDRRNIGSVVSESIFTKSSAELVQDWYEQLPHHLRLESVNINEAEPVHFFLQMQYHNARARGFRPSFCELVHSDVGDAQYHTKTGDSSTCGSRIYPEAHAWQCIDAAKQSLEAFTCGDPLRSKTIAFISPFATAQKLLENVLILGAAVRSPSVGSLVDVQSCSWLIAQALQYTQILALRSHSMQVNACITERVFSCFAELSSTSFAMHGHDL